MPDAAQDRFDTLCTSPWHEAFTDPGTGSWEDHWSLDGELATITNAPPSGMDFAAGPMANQDASHAVLWTRESFTGDLKIQYTYTRLDDAVENVNILYVLASGQGTDGFGWDVLDWRERRRVPAMRMYFNHMHTYHISYAAYGVAANDGEDYIRARRYMPNAGKGLRDTEILPDHARTRLFQTGVAHHITVIKHTDDLFMHIRNDATERLCHWNTSAYPAIHDGRVGLRHMASRRSRYRDFSVSVATDTE